MGKINRKFIIVPALLAVLFFLPHMIGNIHWIRVFIECYIWMVVCLGFRLIMRTGELSLAQVAFMGVGAYTVALLTTRLGWNFWICFVLAGIITALMAFIIGFISQEMKKDGKSRMEHHIF